jgi:oxygen-independent coproporphyrinogen-3 oxidase
MEGLDLQQVTGAEREQLEKGAQKYISGGMLLLKEDHFILTREGKLLADGIAADLFF